MTQRYLNKPLMQAKRSGVAQLDRVVRLRFCKVLQYRLEAGCPVLDICDSTGGVYHGCRYVQPGAGGPFDSSNFPPCSRDQRATPSDMTDRSGLAEVLAFFPDVPRPRPIVIGSIMHTLAQAWLTSGDTDQAFADGNNTDPDANDIDLDVLTNKWSALQNTNRVRIIQSYTGFLGLDTSEPNKPIKVHVGKDMYIRVAHGLPASDGSTDRAGTWEVNERVPLANKLFEHEDEHLDLSHDCVHRIEALEAQVNLMATLMQNITLPSAAVAYAAQAVTLGAAGDATGAADATAKAAQATAAAGTVAAPTTSWKGVTGDIFSDIVFDHDVHASSAFRISNKSRADE